MSQKLNPYSVRLPITKTWRSRWFSQGADYGRYLIEDIKIRHFILDRLGENSGLAKIEIERRHNDCKILIHTSRPGILIGWQGKGIGELRKKIESQFDRRVSVNVIELKRADSNARLVAASIGHQISRRIAYRKAIKQAIDKAKTAGAKGIKIVVSGRLRGADIARTEKFVEGLVPTSTFRNQIDFSVFHAQTTYGIIGIKVWIYSGLKVED